MNRIAAVIAGLSLAFVGTSPTIADTINVPGDQPTIAAAISASVNGDVINIAAGTYNEYLLNPGGKAITIQGTLNGDGTLATTIDSQQNGSRFVITSGEGSGTVIKDLMINGSMTEEGGGIRCVNSNPTISDCIITDHWASKGGGIYCNNSNPTISNCTITGNTSYYGGGIYCSNNSNPTISDCTISENTVESLAGSGFGGGIYCEDSSPIISDCMISDNTSQIGGAGISCHDSNPTIIDCTITGNTANSEGGGIWCYEGDTTTIIGCTISGNLSEEGGGIYLNYSDSTINGCTISDNTAGIKGGGIYLNYSDSTIIGCTITGNMANVNYGGGIYSDDSNPTINDSAICSNISDQIYGSYSASGCCIEESCTACVVDTDEDGVPDDQDQCPGYDDNTDADNDGTPDCLECEGDLDSNQLVDIEDLLLVISGWNTESGDTNDDGITDIGDLLLIIDLWGNICEAPGACCLQDETCAVTDAAGCENAGGNWNGSGTYCNFLDCPEYGACCWEDYTCTVMFSDACTSAGGSFRGQDSDCDTTDCTIAEYNDECKDAMPAGNGSILISTLEATTSTDLYTDELCTGTYLGAMNADIWFSYDSSCNGTLTVSTCDTVNFDTDLVVYEGTCANMTQIACNGDSTCTGYASYLETPITAGSSYLIRLGGWDSESVGTGTLLIECASDE